MIDIHKIWQETKQNISGEITAVAYLLWIEKLVPVSIKDNVMILMAPSRNAKITVNKTYKEMILKALLKVRGTFIDVEIIVEDDLPLYEEQSDEFHDNQIVINSGYEVSKKTPFLAKYTFDRFMRGESNRLAYSAARGVAANPGAAEGYMSFNPLFIYGNVSYGKTHLMHAIGNFIIENLPSKKVLYVPTEKFANEYIEAISSEKKNKSINAFRDKYRTVDVLMLDDVQFLEKKTGLQDVFFHIFNELYQSGKQIVLSSDRPPKDIGTLEDRLRSRFEGGLLADITPPDLELRIAILKQHMLDTKQAVNDEVLNYIAEQFSDNIREMQGALNKVLLFASLTDKPFPDLGTAKEALKTSTPRVEGLESSDIIHAVCTYFRVNKSDIVSKKKTKEIVEARMFAIYLITELLNLPLVTIGQLFGGRDHTTIIYSRDKVHALLKEKPDVERKMKDIKDILKI